MSMKSDCIRYLEVSLDRVSSMFMKRKKSNIVLYCGFYGGESVKKDVPKIFFTEKDVSSNSSKRNAKSAPPLHICPKLPILK